MVGTPSRRHFKSLFANSSVSPGLSAALKIFGIFRHYDAFHRQFTCTLKDDEALYDTLQLQMNEVYSNEIECNTALRVNLKFHLFDFYFLFLSIYRFFFLFSSPSKFKL